MAYIEDSDLEFLQNCRQEDLHILVEYLTLNKKGKKRWGQMLTSHPRYQEFYPQHNKYWNLIAAEIQFAGGNLFANLMTGEGVLYRKTLEKVCKKLKVQLDTTDLTTVQIEQRLLTAVMMSSLEKMSEEELKELADNLDVRTQEVTRKALIGVVQTAMTLGKLKPKAIATILANSVAKLVLKKGLKLGAYKGLKLGLKKWGGFLLKTVASPLGIILTATWIVHDLTAPAYRIMIPVVIQVAYMRIVNEQPHQIVETP